MGCSLAGPPECPLSVHGAQPQHNTQAPLCGVDSVSWALGEGSSQGCSRCPQGETLAWRGADVCQDSGRQSPRQCSSLLGWGLPFLTPTPHPLVLSLPCAWGGSHARRGLGVGVRREKEKEMHHLGPGCGSSSAGMGRGPFLLGQEL